MLPRLRACALALPWALGLQGLGMIHDVEPLMGRMGGGTELRIAGTGLAQVVKAYIGHNVDYASSSAVDLAKRECRIFEVLTTDSLLICVTPPVRVPFWFF